MVKIRIGTRKSPLAMKQAEEVRDRLIKAHSFDFEDIELCPMVSEGDRILDRAILEVGGKAVFTKEIEKALIDQKVDIAVHSLKDMEVKMPNGLAIGAVLPREDPFDAFLSFKYKSLDEMPEGAVLGTSSIRRQAAVLAKRPDLKITLFRGNVQTRYQKLKDGVADATFLAMAGLNRLGLAHYAIQKMTIDEMIPAPGQGVIAIQMRENDKKTAELLEPLHCPKTHSAMTLERLFLDILDGSCHTPVAAHAYFKSTDEIVFKGQILKPDGSESYDVQLNGKFDKLHEEIAAEATKIRQALPEGFLEIDESKFRITR